MTSKIGIVQVVSGFADEFGDARLKVAVPFAVQGRWTYWRFGREFGPEPTELALSELGPDPVKIAQRILCLAQDKPTADSLVKRLSVALVLPDGTEMAVGEPETGELFAFVAADGAGPA